MKELEEVKRQSLSTKNMRTLTLHNDDVNTFDHVIDCLVKYCDHDALQAEQCSMIVHYNGKCDVKRGDLKKLIGINKVLINQGLTTSIN